MYGTVELLGIFYAIFQLVYFAHLGIASDGLKGRVFEVSLADLQNDEVAFRKFKLITEDVQGKNCLTNFHGMDLTRDKMCSMVKKWQVMYIYLQMVLDHLLRLTVDKTIFDNYFFSLCLYFCSI